jgi:hypothetical protein
MKTDCLQRNKIQHYLGQESDGEAGGVGERVGKLAIIKSLIYVREKRAFLYYFQFNFYLIFRQILIIIMCFGNYVNAPFNLLLHYIFKYMFVTFK